MGIPIFYSWLLEKYPEIKISCENDNHLNGIKCDNLYIDMNQIIHQCAQSIDVNTIIKLVFDRIDRILSIIRPRQLLYMAIDGVAPRAKMTHQRTDCFLKSKTINDKSKHQIVSTETFDECNIKPGTKFMSKLSKCLQFYISHRMNTKQDCDSLKIILSDANVPGEGEHKIINFIRQQRIQQNNDSNTYHVIYGSDSDLVLLGLLTHEHNLTIICEECRICGKIGHDAKDCDTNKSSLTIANDMGAKYVVIDLSKLNNCLKYELEKNNSFSFQRKPERSIDDWVFICLLFGNDFLPKSPSINFSGNNINMDNLIDTYKKIVEETKGYLTENHTININRLLRFLRKVSEKDLDGKISRQRYYEDKFDINATQPGTFSIKVATNYVQGLCWIFQYYYQGPPSWNWYYPYYYAPLAYDFSNLKGVSLNFDQNTKPFRPFEQMMATFSPQNAKYLPPEWQSLMLNEKSPIIEFYPQNFKVDPNGKKKSSQYVALIPFINENRLLQALEPVYSTLTQEEEERNILDYDRLFIHSQNLYYKNFKELSDNGKTQITENNPIKLQKILNSRLVGYVWPDDNIINIDSDEEALLSDYKNISHNQVIRFKYCDSLLHNESAEKDMHKGVHLQTTSNQSNSGSTVQSQQQQVYKPSPWDKPS